MKILVDKMPTIPQQCLFSTPSRNAVIRYTACKLNKNRKCEDTSNCRYLKADNDIRNKRVEVKPIDDAADFEEFSEDGVNISHICGVYQERERVYASLRNKKEEKTEWNDKCPKCGSQDTFVAIGGRAMYFVQCNDCSFTTEYHATRDDAIEEWNEVHKVKTEGLIKRGIILHPFTATTYSEAAMRTADKTLSDEKALMEGLVGINSEAGEALDIWKKYEFHKHDLDKESIALELGDVLWYLNEAALALGYSLEQIMLANIKKLEERYPNGFDPERSKNREE